MAWVALFGTVSFELFGQLHGIIGEQPGDREAYFAESVRRYVRLRICREHDPAATVRLPLLGEPWLS